MTTFNSLRSLVLIGALCATALGCNALREANHYGALADAEPLAVAAATVATFEEMTIPVLSNEATGLDARVVGRNATGDEIKVSVDRESAGHSRVWIRVGTFGDDSYSAELWERIKAKL